VVAFFFALLSMILFNRMEIFSKYNKESVTPWMNFSFHFWILALYINYWAVDESLYNLLS